MTIGVRLAVLGLALVAVAGCTNPSGFGGTGAGATAATGGSPADPRSAAYFQQTVGDRVLFAVDESTLSADARSVLVGQANWLMANPEFSAIVEGHADEQGTREYNLALGERRANAVQEFLVTQGVAGGRVQIVTYGKERPLEICSEESCYAKNRRAVTVLTAGAGS